MSHPLNSAGAAALLLASGLACAQGAAPLILAPSFSLTLPADYNRDKAPPVEATQPAEFKPAPVATPALVEIRPAVVDTPRPAEVRPVVVDTPRPAEVRPVVVDTPRPVEIRPAVVDTARPAEIRPAVVDTPRPAEYKAAAADASRSADYKLPAADATQPGEYKLSPGDAIKVQVYQNPDLTLEARVSEAGTIGYPLVGSVAIGGLSLSAAEKRIADALAKGDFLKQPQVNIVLLQVRGNQVSVLGQVHRPGRFVLETTNVRVSDLLAQAGHVTPQGADTLVVTGTRDGKPFRKAIDIPGLFRGEGASENLLVQPGDTLYVDKAPTFYIYGEAQRPGTYRIERGMTILQALAQGGGPTQRGSERVRVNRTRPDGTVIQLEPHLTEPVQPGDVLYVRESLF